LNNATSANPEIVKYCLSYGLCLDCACVCLQTVPAVISGHPSCDISDAIIIAIFPIAVTIIPIGYNGGGHTAIIGGR
jgi:hypothetical protein